MFADLDKASNMPKSRCRLCFQFLGNTDTWFERLGRASVELSKNCQVLMPRAQIARLDCVMSSFHHFSASTLPTRSTRLRQIPTDADPNLCHIPSYQRSLIRFSWLSSEPKRRWSNHKNQADMLRYFGPAVAVRICARRAQKDQ